MALPLTYHWRSLFVRKTTTLLTVLVVAAVVGVLTWMMGFAAALKTSLSMASDDHKIIVLRNGATSESNSALPVDQFNKLEQLSDVLRDTVTGAALISPEMMVQVSLPRLNDPRKSTANVAVRGVTEKAFQVHRNVKVLGRQFSTGAPEVIVGKSAAKQFGGLEIGQTLRLGYSGDRNYTIVGHFSADGGPMESEIWGYLPSLMNSYNRTMYSSAQLRLRDTADPKAAIAIIHGPSIEMAASTEREYWQQQAGNVRMFLGVINLLVVVMCLAAVFSIANTMFSMVAGRTREIAMLRTIGYTGAGILTGFVIEAVLLAVLGGVLGCLGCAGWLSLVGSTKDMFGSSSFTTMAFEIRLTPAIALWALLSVAVIGAVGAIFPAWRAKRLHIVSALRQA